MAWDGVRIQREKKKPVKSVKKRYEAKTVGWGLSRPNDKGIPPRVDRKMRTEKSR